MRKQCIQIPFTNFDKPGIIEVECSVITNPVTSGFDILKEFVSDINMCIGYPIMHACVKEFQGFGVSRYCGWIQIVTMEFYSDANAENPDDIYYGVDVTPTMKQNGLPFFAYGYPAEIYDPPCNNYFTGPKLIWNTDTFLVTMPSFLNNECISYLAGFQWGYKEYRDGMDKSIDIFPLEDPLKGIKAFMG